MTPIRRDNLPDTRQRGFTLVELIVSTIMLSVIVGATTLVVFQSLRSRDAARAGGEAFSRAQIAAGRIVADAQNALRDTDLLKGKVQVTAGGVGGTSGLLLLTHQQRPVRTGYEVPEGEEYEVQYRLEPATIRAASANSRLAQYSLWRRADPNLDDTVDGGGVAAAVVDGVTTLTVEAYDGQKWLTAWDSDADGYPFALRVTVSACDEAGKRVSTARRVVAIDRTPLPLPAPEEETDSATDPATGGGQ